MITISQVNNKMMMMMITIRVICQTQRLGKPLCWDTIALLGQ